MITTRLSEDRGHADHGWLNAYHSFSFSEYHDPKWMGYSDLRVINEDRIAPGTGFAPHGHRDMEIITYILDGAIAHQDSSGGSGVIRRGEVQVMSAGSGIRHSEKNPSNTEPTHLLQIWIEPDQSGIKPRYGQVKLDEAEMRRGFSRIFAPQGEAATFNVQQDARLDIAWPAAGQKLEKVLKPERKHYLHIARGEVKLGDRLLRGGDAAMLEGESSLALEAATEAEVLLFDLAA